MAMSDARSERLSLIAVCGLFALLPALAHFAPAQIVALALLAALLLLVADPAAVWRLADDPWPPALLVGLAAFGLLSALWAVDAPRSVDRSARLTVEIFVGLLLMRQVAAVAARSDWPRRILLVGVVAFLAVFAIDAASGAALSRASRAVFGLNPPPALAELHRPGTLLAMLVWPAAALLARRGRRFASLGLLGVALLALMHSTGTVGLAALLAGLAVAGIALASPRLAAALLAAALVALVLAGPWLLRPVAGAEPPGQRLLAAVERSPALTRPVLGMSHRLYIWQFAAARIGERPLLGWGLDSARAIPGGNSSVAEVFGAPAAWAAPSPLSEMAAAEVMPLHPHNATFQLLLEVGYLGTLPAVLLVLLALWRTVRIEGPRILPAAALGMAGSMLVVLHLSYGIWQSWWLASLFLAVAAMRAACLPPPPT